MITLAEQLDLDTWFTQNFTQLNEREMSEIDYIQYQAQELGIWYEVLHKARDKNAGFLACIQEVFKEYKLDYQP